jgi:hypothetical protein
LSDSWLGLVQGTDILSTCNHHVQHFSLNSSKLAPALISKQQAKEQRLLSPIAMSRAALEDFEARRRPVFLLVFSWQ